MAKNELKRNGILMEYLNILMVDQKLPKGFLKQKGGTHADEGETSMMLYIAPQLVDMSKAVEDYDSRPNRRGLTRNPEGTGHYSPTGIWGNHCGGNGKRNYQTGPKNDRRRIIYVKRRNTTLTGSLIFLQFNI